MSIEESILKIQKEYSGILEHYFGKEKREIGNRIDSKTICDYVLNRTKKDFFSIKVPYKGTYITPSEYKVFSLYDELDNFWSKNSLELKSLIKESEFLYLYSGYAPFSLREKLENFSLYFDTICIPCPFHPFEREITERELYSERRLVHFIKEFSRCIDLINMLSNYSFNTYPPLFIVFKEEFYLSQKEKYYLKNGISQDDNKKFRLISDKYYFHIKKFFEEIIGCKYNFESSDEAKIFLSSFNISKIKKENFQKFLKLVNLDNLDFRLDFEKIHYQDRPEIVSKDIEGLIDRNLEYKDINNHTLTFLFDILISFILTTESAYLNSCFYKLEPNINPDHWETYCWKLMNESNEINHYFNVSENELIAYIFSSKNLKIFKDIPLELIINIRNNNGLEKIRNLFREGRKNIGNAKISDLENITNQIIDQINYNILEFSKKFDESKKKRRKIQISLASLITSVVLSLSSIVFPQIFPLAVTANAFTVIYSSTDFYFDYKKDKKDIEAINKNPLAILLK